MLQNRTVFEEEHALLRESVRRFAETRIRPHFQEWEKAGIIDPALWPAAGQAGLLCPQVPETYGGVGGDFRHNAAIIEELSYSGFAGPATDFSVHNDVCCGYLLSYGTVAPDQTIEVLIRWDHRVTDGAPIAKALTRLEQVLNTEIAAELRSLRRPVQARSIAT